MSCRRQDRVSGGRTRRRAGSWGSISTRPWGAHDIEEAVREGQAAQADIAMYVRTQVGGPPLVDNSRKYNAEGRDASHTLYYINPIKCWAKLADVIENYVSHKLLPGVQGHSATHIQQL
jgi:hypothetical protein